MSADFFELTGAIITLCENLPWDDWRDIPDDADPVFVNVRDAMDSLEETKKNLARASEVSRRLDDIGFSTLGKLHSKIVNAVASDAFICGLSVAGASAEVSKKLLEKAERKLSRTSENSQLIDDFIRDQRAIKQNNGRLTSDESIALKLNEKTSVDSRYRSASESGMWTRQSVNARRKRAGIM